MRKHRVRFTIPDDAQMHIPVVSCSTEDAELTVEEKRRLWYTKSELLIHRRDVRQAIKALRRMSTDNLLDHDTDDDEVCMRGCERYYNLELRYLVQKTIVEAVLETQLMTKDWNAIRKVSESFSDPGKDLAVWHATVNAYHCWGTSGLKTRRYRTA